MFEDANRNGRQDTGETGAAGQLRLRGPQPQPPLRRGRAVGRHARDGAYAISGLADGSYSVGVFPKRGSSPPASSVEVTVTGGTTAVADFGRVTRQILPISDRSLTEGQPASFAPSLANGADQRLIYSLEPGAPLARPSTR